MGFSHDDLDSKVGVFFAPRFKHAYNRYNQLSVDGASSFVSALARECDALGFILNWVREERPVGTYTGKSSEREGLETGVEIVNECAVFTATKHAS